MMCSTSYCLVTTYEFMECMYVCMYVGLNCMKTEIMAPIYLANFHP